MKLEMLVVVLPVPDFEDPAGGVVLDCLVQDFEAPVEGALPGALDPVVVVAPEVPVADLGVLAGLVFLGGDDHDDDRGAYRVDDDRADVPCRHGDDGFLLLRNDHDLRWHDDRGFHRLWVVIGHHSRDVHDPRGHDDHGLHHLGVVIDHRFPDVLDRLRCYGAVVAGLGCHEVAECMVVVLVLFGVVAVLLGRFRHHVLGDHVMVVLPVQVVLDGNLLNPAAAGGPVEDVVQVHFRNPVGGYRRI